MEAQALLEYMDEARTQMLGFFSFPPFLPTPAPRHFPLFSPFTVSDKSIL